MTAAVAAIRVSPFSECLFAVKENHIDVVTVLSTCDCTGEFKEKSRGRTTVVCADEIHHRNVLCVVVPGDHDGLPGCSGELQDEVRHWNRAGRSLPVEGIGEGFAPDAFQLRDNPIAKLAEVRGAGCALAEGDGMFRLCKGGGTAKFKRPGRPRGAEDQAQTA